MIILIESFEEVINLKNGEWSGLRGNMKTQLKEFESQEQLKDYLKEEKSNHSYRIFEGKELK